MVFFLFLISLTGLAWLAGRLGVPFLRDRRACMRLALAGALVFFGADHLLTPERYLPMVQDWLPWAAPLVALTGICEIAGGLGLLALRLRHAAGLSLAVYFVAVFPANVHNALNGLNAAGLPDNQWYYWVRLGLQPLAVWWALYSSGILNWPFGGNASDTGRPSAEVSRKSAHR